MDAGADMQPRRRGASCFACGPVLHKPPETPNCGQTSGGSQFVDPAAGQCVPCFGARSPNLRAHRRWIPEIGRASCRERVCQYVSITVVAVSLKKKIKVSTE